MSDHQPFDLAASTYRHVLDAPKPQVAVLPLGATEPHNLHLPYGTDTYQVTMLAEQACAKAAGQGAPVWLLPAIPYGTETNMMRFPLTINVNPSTLGRMIGDIVESLEKHGVKKLVLLNGHGGNELKWILREWYDKADVHIFICHWFRMIGDIRKDVLEDLAGDHADELETSTMLYLRPDLVHTEAADEGSMRPPRLETLKKGWVEYSRPWHVLTTNTGAGNPSLATAEKGQRLAEAFVDRFSTFLVELAAAEIDGDFPLEKR
jgi:creatinine amidohydrolase